MRLGIAPGAGCCAWRPPGLPLPTGCPPSREPKARQFWGRLSQELHGVGSAHTPACSDGALKHQPKNDDEWWYGGSDFDRADSADDSDRSDVFYPRGIAATLADE